MFVAYKRGGWPALLVWSILNQTADQIGSPTLVLRKFNTTPYRQASGWVAVSSAAGFEGPNDLLL